MKKKTAYGLVILGVVIPLCVLSQKAPDKHPGHIAQTGQTGIQAGQADTDVKEDAAPAERDVVSGGMIRFTGMISSPTCVINGGNGGENFVVNLPTVPANRFGAKGKTAGETRFNITLSGCGEPGTRIRANFQKGVMVDTSNGRLNIDASNTRAAKNIQIELASSNDAPVVIGVDQQTTSYFPVDKNGNVEMVYLARYYATGKVTPGHVTSQVTYVLEYQ